MSVQQLNIQKLREHLKSFQFDKLFVEGLGWNYPEGKNTLTVKINNSSIPYNRIAEINQVPILKFNENTLEQFKRESEREKLHKKIKDIFHNHLLLFSDNKNSVTLSYFSKEEQVRTHDWFKGQSEDDFIGKLTDVHFSIENAPKIMEIGKKLEKAFDSEKVIKRFFTNFKTNHLHFQKYISGIKNDEEKKWYASIILNRLMFVWFLQKRALRIVIAIILKLNWNGARQEKKTATGQSF